jgi:hypothetical protein
VLVNLVERWRQIARSASYRCLSPGASRIGHCPGCIRF